MKKTRQPIPESLAETPPGPGLAAALAEIDLSRLGGLDCVTVMRAQHRQAAHEQARLMAAMVEVARCGIGPDDDLPRMDAPDEFSADEIRGALVWTRAAANSQLSLAWDLTDRIPAVFAALERGSIDVPKTKVFSEWSSGLTEEQARRVCDALLPEAPGLTTGQLADRIKKMAIAIDPDWARRRYEEAVRDRKVVGYRNEDGSANLCGYQLPADRAAAASAHIDTLARKIKHAGDGRPINHIRADLYVAMLDGSYTGHSEHDIIAHMLAMARAAAEQSAAECDVHRLADASPLPQVSKAGRGRCLPDEGGAVPAPPDDRTDGTGLGADDQDTGASRSCGHVIEGPWPPAGATALGADGRADEIVGAGLPRTFPAAASQAGGQQTPASTGSTGHHASHTAPPARRAGVEVRAEVTALLGLDDHPGELPGSGPVHADLVRRLVREQTAAEWRYAITDDDGHLLFEGITRRRPTGYPSRAEAPCRGGIVELQIPLSTLKGLAAGPIRADGWTNVIADLARQADKDDQADHAAQGSERSRRDGKRRAEANSDDRPRRGLDEDEERGPRSPGRPMRRHTEIRDRTCTHPRCRAPAHGTDGDHIEEWARGGRTAEGNIGSACRHDHRLRHEGGWTVRQSRSGELIWTARLGVHYRVRPPLIIQPVPDPLPREPIPTYEPDDQQEGPIWREPIKAPVEPGRAPPPDPDEPVPF